MPGTMGAAAAPGTTDTTDAATHTTDAARASGTAGLTQARRAAETISEAKTPRGADTAPATADGLRTAVPPPPSEVARSSSPAGDKPPPKVALSGKANGLALAVLGVAVAWLAHHLAPAVPMLTIAVVLGIVAAHLPGLRTLVRGSCRAGLSYAGKRLMRLGIVLLGLKLSLDDVLDLGWATVGMVFAVVAATFFGTLWLGRKLGLNGDQPLLIATGYSICGASAIGAVSEASESDERDVATSVALVTLCGTLAIVVLPLLQHPLGLSDAEFGRWAGASVHDVGQVVATAQTAGSGALSDAVLVKLMRVAMLAPLVAAVALSVRARSRSRTAPREAGVDATSTASANQAGTAAGATDATDAAAPAARPSAGPGARRPPLVPLFVLGFLAMVALRSTGWLSGGAIDTADHAQELLLAAALFGLGSAVHLPSLARTGGRVAALGLCSWLVIAGASYAGVLLTT